MNQLIYDSCAYKQKLNANAAISNYAMYDGKYQHNAPCRIQLGQVGGNGVSLYNGNMVDLESDLKGITRNLSLCNKSKYQPKCRQCYKCKDTGLPCGCLECASENLIHQPNCQMVDYKPVIDAPPFVPQTCQKVSGPLYGANGTFIDKIRSWF